MSARTARPGYGLLMAVMGLVAISAIVALAVTPNVAQVQDQWRVEHAIERLTILTDGGTSLVRFNDDIGNYPSKLSHLSSQITETDFSLCERTYNKNSVDSWGGRYAGRLFLPAGTPFSIGTVKDTVEHDAAGSALVVVIQDVREEQARRLDRKVDGTADGAAGRVRYTAADAQGLVTMRWRKAIQKC